MDHTEVRSLVCAVTGVGARDRLRLEPVSVGVRARSWRVRAADADTPAVIVKQFHARTDERPGPAPVSLFANECAALGALSDSGVTPRLLGDDPEHLALVIEDVGPGSDLFARARCGQDGHGARDYARALARVHRAGRRRLAEFTARRARLDGTPPHAHPLDSAEPAAHVLRAFADARGARWDPVPAVSVLVDALRADREFLGVAVVDVCPDNVVFTDDGTRVLDFEFACATHVLVDVASLLLGFPNCGVELAIPDRWSVVDEYRRALVPDLDAAADAARFARDVRRCAAAWAVTATAHRLGSPDAVERTRGRRTLAALAALAAGTSTHDPLLADIAAGARDLGVRLDGSAGA